MRIMKRKLISILLAASLLLMPVVASSDIEKLGHDEIIINAGVYEDSYLQFLKATSDKSVKHWNVRIHTSGGDAHSTIGIINRIKEIKKTGVTFTMINQSKAFSAGSYIFIHGDKRVAHRGASFMFHTIMQQVDEQQVAAGRGTNPSTVTLLERMDELVNERFLEITGIKKGSQADRYWLHGEMPDGSTVVERAQFMSAETAFNINVATDYINN